MYKEKIKYIRVGETVSFLNLKNGCLYTGKYMERWHNEHATFLSFEVFNGEVYETVSVVEEYLSAPDSERTKMRDDGYARVQAEIDKYNKRTDRNLFVGENSGSVKLICKHTSSFVWVS